MLLTLFRLLVAVAHLLSIGNSVRKASLILAWSTCSTAGSVHNSIKSIACSPRVWRHSAYLKQAGPAVLSPAVAPFTEYAGSGELFRSWHSNGQSLMSISNSLDCKTTLLDLRWLWASANDALPSRNCLGEACYK